MILYLAFLFIIQIYHSSADMIVLTYPEVGHINPIYSLVKGVVENNEKVIVFSTEKFKK